MKKTLRLRTCFLLLLSAHTCLSPSESTPESEVIPEGVNFLRCANSLPALSKAANADLAWVDDDGAAVFLWINRRNDPKAWTFVIDRAYRLNQHGSNFWCFLDHASVNNRKFDDPIAQFFIQKFCRETARVSSGHSDSNASYAELLSTNTDGSLLFKIVYCSVPGPGAHQELVKTYLALVEPGGECKLASKDLGHEGSNPHGHIGQWDSFEFKVKWGASSSQSPFEANIRKRKSVFVTDANDNTPSYQTYQEGRLKGSLPYTLELSDRQYLESDGTNSLAYFASLLLTYQTGSPPEESKDSTEHTRELRQLISELQRLNPRLPVGIPIGVKVKIFIPTHSAFASITVKD